MSLISINNFIAPFTNKTHMGTIVLGAVLFAFFRLQGGTIAIHNDERVTPRSVPASNEARPSSEPIGAGLSDLGRAPASPARNNAVTNQELPEEGTISITNDEGDLLEDIMGSSSKNTRSKPQAQNPEQPSRPAGRPSSGGLDDIERSLGIR